MAILEEQSSPKGVPSKTFEARWGASYVTPGNKTVTIDFFGDDLSYDEADRSLLADLRIGESVTLDAGDHQVTRIT